MSGRAIHGQDCSLLTGTGVCSCGAQAKRLDLRVKPAACTRCGHLKYSHRSDGGVRMPCTAVGFRICDCKDFEEKTT
jgi:hypothetical protein